MDDRARVVRGVRRAPGSPRRATTIRRTVSAFMIPAMNDGFRKGRLNRAPTQIICTRGSRPMRIPLTWLCLNRVFHEADVLIGRVADHERADFREDAHDEYGSAARLENTYQVRPRSRKASA